MDVMLRHGNNLPFSLRVSFVPFESLWLSFFNHKGAENTKIHKEKSAIMGILQYSSLRTLRYIWKFSGYYYPGG